MQVRVPLSPDARECGVFRQNLLNSSFGGAVVAGPLTSTRCTAASDRKTERTGRAQGGSLHLAIPSNTSVYVGWWAECGLNTRTEALHDQCVQLKHANGDDWGGCWVGWDSPPVFLFSFRRALPSPNCHKTLTLALIIYILGLLPILRDL